MSALDISQIKFPESPLNKGVHWTKLEKEVGEYISQIKSIKNSELQMKCEILIEEARMAVFDTSATSACLNCRVALSKIFTSKTKSSSCIAHFQKFFLAICDLLPVDKIIESDAFGSQLKIIASDFFVKVCLEVDNIEKSSDDIIVKISRYQKISSLNNATNVILRSFAKDKDFIERFEKIKKAIKYSTHKTKMFTSKVLGGVDLEFDLLEKIMELMNILKNLDESGVNNKIEEFRDKLGTWILNSETLPSNFESLCLFIRDALNYVKLDEISLNNISVYFKIPQFQSSKFMIISNFTKAIMQIHMTVERFEILARLNNDFEQVYHKISDENLRTQIDNFLKLYKTFTSLCFQ